MEIADVGDARLAYQVSGTGEPVIFVHGAQIAESLQPLLTEPGLCSRHKLITYHLRGYQGSTHSSRAVSIAQQVADCRELVGHLGIRRAHFVERSLGDPFVSNAPWTVRM